MKKEKGFTLIALIISVFLIGLFVFVYSSKNKNQSSTKPATPTPSITVTPTLNGTADWEVYEDPNKNFSFKHPKNLEYGTSADGVGANSIRFSYMGEKQKASGRTQTELWDGYAFTVAKMDDDSLNPQKEAQKAQKNAKEGCPAENIIVSEVSEIEINGIVGYQYTEECMGNATVTYVSDGNNLYNIVQFYAGDEEDFNKYKNITDLMLSTLRLIKGTTKTTDNNKNISKECGVCGPQGIHNVEGNLCAEGLVCKNGVTTTASYCVRPQDDVSKCE